MSQQLIMTLIAIFWYGLASIVGIGGLLSKSRACLIAGVWLSAMAFVCQTLILLFGYHKSLASGPSMGAYLQLPAWFALLCGLLAWLFFKRGIFALFAAPLAFILFLMSMPSLGSQLDFPVYLSVSFYVLHVGTLFLSLGMLALAFVCAIVFLLLEKRIKKKKIVVGVWKDMPALAILDKINSICALAAFPLYTTGIIAGYFWATPIFGASLRTDPKMLVSLLVWLLLAILFHNRLAKNWKGRKPAVFIILIFSLSFFSIFVINFFFPTHHSFLQG